MDSSLVYSDIISFENNNLTREPTIVPTRKCNHKYCE